MDHKRQGQIPMAADERFIELVNLLCNRPRLFVAGGSYHEVCAYLLGYAHGAADCPLNGDGGHAFQSYVCARLGCPSKYTWDFAVLQFSRDEDEAVARLQGLLKDFVERTRTESLEEIVRDVTRQARGREESGPVRAWRAFSRAIHGGGRHEIEPLIQSHPDAGVLWAASYPDDVAALLDQIQESQFVSIATGSEDFGEVTILTPDFGLVGVKRIDGRWRVDASKIIDCWKANRS